MGILYASKFYGWEKIESNFRFLVPTQRSEIISARWQYLYKFSVIEKWRNMNTVILFFPHTKLAMFQ